MNIPPLFKHQQQTVDFLTKTPRAIDTSDPGTGKTRGSLETIRRRNTGKRTLVLAPKTILEPAWAEDIKKFTPELTYSIAYAGKREKAFEENTRIVLMNHDGVKWLTDNTHYLTNFDALVIDECTAFKHHTSQRSKAIAKIKDAFKYRTGLTGTPTANGLLGLWHQMYLLDDGQHLGNNFYRYRNAICDPKPIGTIMDWAEKPEAKFVIPTLIQDINIRHKFEDCTDIPENRKRTLAFDLKPEHLKTYKQFLKHSLAEIDGRTINAINAAVLNGKLLQIASGAVYDSFKETVLLDTTRYELVMDLIEEREQCVVAFSWNHQREELIKLAKRRRLSFGTIDGNTSIDLRNKAVRDFQNGELRAIFAHPKSASHGLTLTRGVATIWASPLYNLELYEQLFRRIYRTGQTKPTETIHISANDTIDPIVYKKLSERDEDHKLVLQLLQSPL